MPNSKCLGRINSNYDRKQTELRAGTLLTREWNDKSERVMVLNYGYAWSGNTYGSLLQVAFAITGTRGARKASEMASPLGSQPHDIQTAQLRDLPVEGQFWLTHAVTIAHRVSQDAATIGPVAAARVESFSRLMR